MKIFALAATTLMLTTALPGQVTTAPKLAPAPVLRLPTVERATLPNGVTVIVSRNAEVPIVEARLVIDGGARTPGAPLGLAAFTATMLTEGAAGRDALSFSQEVDYLGARLNAGSGWEYFTLSLRTPKRNADPAFALMADMVFKPNFLAEDVARERELRIAAQTREKDSPGSVAGRVFFRNVFPGTHPYHDDLSGDSASISRFDSATVRTFWSQAIDPHRATLIVTGDVTLAEATGWATRHFGAWVAPAASPPKPPASRVASAPAPPTRIILVDKPGAAQSVILIGAPGVPRNSADYPAITLMNTIMGGSFSSRLNDQLREKLGYSYGAGSNFSWSPVPGPFVASAQVRTNVTDSSLLAFFREFRKMRDEPVTPVELTRGRNYVVLGSLGDYETAGEVAGAIVNSVAFNRPLSAIPAEYAVVKTLTAADVQRAAQKYLDPAHLTVVIVGDVEKIRPGIEKLKLGSVQVQVF